MTVEIEAIKKIDLKDTDVLVFKLNLEGVPAQPRERIVREAQERWKELFPNNKVLVITNNVEMSVISQSEYKNSDEDDK